MVTTSSPQAEIKSLLAEPEPDGMAVASILDSLAIGDCVLAAREFSGNRTQKALWNVAAAQDPIRTSDLIPDDYEPMKPVVFHGKN